MTDGEETDCLDSWEQLEDSGALDKKLEQIQIKSEAVENGFSSGSKSSSVVIFRDDSQLKYLAQEPSVKILKRPTREDADGPSVPNGELKPKLPIKSLQQRELEYAQARLRIMGEAAAQEPSAPSAPSAPSDDRLSKLSKWEVSGEESEQGSSSSSSCRILREPRGPDGSAGFKLAR